MNILIVEDEESKRLTLLADIAQAGHTVQAVDCAPEALRVLERESLDVVITDLKLPGMDGLELLRTIKAEIAPDTEVILMTAYGTIPLAVEAIRNGALDFVTKPFDNRQLIPLLARVEQKMARREPTGEEALSPEALEIEKAFVGRSPSVRHLKHLIRVAAESDANVLICGETGTGKDLTASLIHRHSRRHSHPFVKVNCAMFPEALVESELFGHERGAFTGADNRKTGRIELADGGSLYLDDADDIPLREQVKLLRLIEEKTFERVGSTTSLRSDVRFIASSKVDLSRSIERGEFRRDLYYRLKVLEIHIPPLREHPEDIPLLARHLLERVAEALAPSLDPEVLRALAAHDWPGNVRELSHSLHQAWILGRGLIRPEHLNLQPGAPVVREASGSFRSEVERTEREMLLAALEKHDGNKTRAARGLGMKASTFRDKLRKFGLD